MKIRVGTMGTGFIVPLVCDGMKRSGRFVISAVCSRSAERAREMAATLGAEKLYTSFDAMLADADIDLIYLASPNSLHFEQAKRALLAGKHVLVEKPFAVNRKQAEELVRLARAHQCFLFENISTMDLPNYEQVRENLSKIGRIRLVLCQYSQYSSRYDAFKAGENPNVFNPAFAGGALMDLNLYNIYFVMGLFGVPLDVKYFPNCAHNGMDTSGICVLQYEDFVCQCTAAKDTIGDNFAQIQGEDGYIIVREPNGCAQVSLHVRKSQARALGEPGTEGFRGYAVDAIGACMQAGDYAECARRLERSCAVVSVLEKARKSAGILFPADKKW